MQANLPCHVIGLELCNEAVDAAVQETLEASPTGCLIDKTVYFLMLRIFDLNPATRPTAARIRDELSIVLGKKI